MRADQVRVAVIVDDLSAERRRRCFWDEQLDQLGVQWEHVSLLDYMNNIKFFDVYVYDVVIFNWCVLDGAVMYWSDRLQAIVEFYDAHFRRFVQGGGVLIMENQPKRWHPSQRGYSVLLGDQVRVTPPSVELVGDAVRPTSRARKHPLLSTVGDPLVSAYAHGNESWFPEGSTSRLSLETLRPTKMYSGGFSSWKPDWIPVLSAEDCDIPVMLMKTHGRGLWIVSTMFLASSNRDDLIRACVLGHHEHPELVESFHRRYQQGRWINLALGIGVLVAVGMVAGALVRANLLWYPDVFSETVAGSIVMGFLYALVLSGLTFTGRWVFQRFRYALNRN